MTVAQADFAAALLDPDMQVPNGLIDPFGRVAGNRFDVYRNNVVCSLIDSLHVAFPVICKLLGDEFFNAMAGIYVRESPPKTPLLMFYGVDFSDFLSQFPPVAHLPYLPDVARLELARRQSYHAKDVNTIDPSILIRLPESSLSKACFTLSPSTILLQSDFPIHSIWHFNIVDPNIKVVFSAEKILIFRRNFNVNACIISKSIYNFIEQLMLGAHIEEANDIAVSVDEKFDLSKAIGLTLQTEIISKISI